MIKYDRNPAGIEIKFEPVDHIYTVKGEVYTSVTTVLHNFFPEFESERISKNYAKKHGMTQQEVLNNWAEKGRIACEVGTNTHLFAECKLLNTDLPTPENDRETLLFNYTDICINQLLKKYKFISSERMIFSPRYKIAGSIDVIMECIETGDIVLVDWKTSKVIEKINKFREFGIRGLQHLQHCNYEHYSLQLNMYRRILEIENYFPGKNIRMGIVHIHDGGIESYKIREMSEEISIILEGL